MRILLFLCLLISTNLHAQTSVARDWNNLILEGIRNDYARPTVHARNLFHHSIIAYDAWAAYDPSKDTYLLGDTLHGYICEFTGIDIPVDIQAAREEAISYASFRFIINRYQYSPDYSDTYTLITNYMIQKGYDINITSTDYANGGPAELGNYLAEQIQLYGYTDGSNELIQYGNTFYTQLNPPLVMADPGNPDIQDPNHWQPLTLIQAIDQSGNPVSSTQPHLSPEWGEVTPFSMDTTMYTEKTRDGMTFKVYFDTVSPAYLVEGDSLEWDSFYKWNHSLVSIWQSHLDTADNVMWDISPASIGNNTWYPLDSSEYSAFYDLTNGGDPGMGYALNPITGLPYAPQIVHRADYARVLAEFWADGLDSETPPGHWFEIYHQVEDYPQFERKWKGVGPELDTLEFDVKTHLALGGAMHDAAIAAWSIKGYYDYLRPVSAIRYMSDQGQSSDTMLPNYDPNGIPLLSGFIELVEVGDPLAGTWNENVGKIKLYTWKGHEYINDPAVDMAGVGWILAENWWPYQRPTFVTPPFAGFVSGHSTFSRAAAEILSFITGSEYFPGGMGEFVAPQNQFLQFEEGPSQTITLQWAKYKDASDQCSLSRIWGGIHPPVDDIQGRFIGEKIGNIAFLEADSIYSIDNPALIATSCSDSVINIADIGSQFNMQFTFNVAMDTSIVPIIGWQPAALSSAIATNQINWIDSFNCEVIFDVLVSTIELYDVKVEITNIYSGTGQNLGLYTLSDYFVVDTKRPIISVWLNSLSDVTDPVISQQMIIKVKFDEPCDTLAAPTFIFDSPNLINPTFTLSAGPSVWLTDTMYQAVYDLADFNETIDDIIVKVIDVMDVYENGMDTMININLVNVDTENPIISSATPSDLLLTQSDLSAPEFNVIITFSEGMNTTTIPVLDFSNQGTAFGSITQNIAQSSWLDSATLDAGFVLFPGTNDLIPLDLIGISITDEKGNHLEDSTMTALIQSDLKSPEVVSVTANRPVIADSVIGTGLYYVDVVFSEAMNESSIPLVMHESAQSLTNSIQYSVGTSQFMDSVTFRAEFQILDENIEVDDIDLTVDFGLDASGNPQFSNTDSAFIDLDTRNPNIIGLYANTYELDQLGELFNVVGVFDEDMFFSQLPELQFNPVINPPTILSITNQVWLNTTTHQFDYELISGPSQSEVYDVSLASGVDLAGNLNIQMDVADFLTINPVVGLNELNQGIVKLYPTIIGVGSELIIESDQYLGNTIIMEMIDLTGKNSQRLEFIQEGEKYRSEPIKLTSGFYFVHGNNMSFKVIVL